MSYARWGCEGSHVYVYESCKGLCCCDCDLANGDYIAKNNAEMVDHLMAHRAVGHVVPESTIQALSQADPPDAD